MSRPSIRPRPLDITRKLKLLKSPDDFEDDEDAIIRSSQLSLLPDSDKTDSSIKKSKGEIPTPVCEIVESYNKNYPANFIQPPTYIRGKLVQSEPSDYVEYDLDSVDEDWLQLLNSKKYKFDADLFEWALNKLELCDHRERGSAGLGPFIFGTAVPVTLQPEAAREALRSKVHKDSLISIIYNYWKDKRLNTKAPLLRRLQPSPLVTDTNPFNVFRPRQKAYRPHTRRMQKKENDFQSYQRLLYIQRNIRESKRIASAIMKREYLKSRLAAIDREAHDHVIVGTVRKEDHAVNDKSRRSTKPVSDQPEPATSANRDTPPAANGRAPPVDGKAVSAAKLSRAAEFGGMKFRRRNFVVSLSALHRKLRKKTKSGGDAQPVLGFTSAPDSEKLESLGIKQEPAASCRFSYRPRIGRGGRLLFDRQDPVLESVPEGSVPVSEGPAAAPETIKALDTGYGESQSTS